MAAWKIAPALACGNTVVLKPAETTPLSALLLARIIEEAELPPGVVNIVTGAGSTGAALAAHSGVDKVAFTGSTEVGKKIQRALAGTKKKLTLELGGKAANVVFADAPIDQAVEGIVNGIYFNQGHVCCAGSRLLVEESVHDLIVRKLEDRIATLRVGDPLDKNTDVGAINSKAQLEKIEQLVLAGEREGAERYSSACALPAEGILVCPHVLYRGRAVVADRARGSLRAGAVRADIPNAGRGDREGEQYDVRIVCRRVDRQGRENILDGPASQGRSRLGQYVQQVRSFISLRRLQGERFRPRRRASGAGGLYGD